MSYTVIITQEDTANITVDETTQNVAVTTSSFPITIEYNATNITANASPYGNAEVAQYLASGSNQLAIITTGNISGNYFVGNGSLLSSITGANVTGTVANATYALTANAATYVTGSVAQANYANIANAVAGANVTGSVAQASYANIANSVSGANVTGSVAQANYANIANSVSGANVTGSVAQASYANIANSVSGANVSGSVAQASYANIANAVAGANVTGTVAQASYANIANAVAGANVTGTVGLAQFVTGSAQGNITSVGTLTSLSVSGNVTGGNLNVTADAVITGNLTVNGTTTTINSNTITTNDKTITLGNNQSTGAALDGAGIDVGSNSLVTWKYNNAANVWASNIGISAVGNVTGAYILGNGSQLTGIASTYGNANVSNFLANGFGSNTISTTGNITSGNSTVTDTLYASNITGAAGQTVTITAEGTNDIHLDADSIRIGDNNQPATVVTHGTGNLILRTHEGAANQGNITVVNGVNGNIQLNPNGTGQVTTTAISATGNVTGAYIIGNGSLLTALTGANVTGTVANATYATSAGSAATATTANTVTDAAQANITSVGTLTSLSVSGNVTGGNLVTAGQVTATGNITGNYFIGNGSQLTGIAGGGSPGGANTYVQFNDGGTFGGTAGLTFDKTSNVLTSAGNLSAVGNVIGTSFNAVNYVASGNLALSGQIFGVGGGILSYFTATNAAGGNGAVGANSITSTGTISAVGNVTGGNINTGGQVSVTGNIIITNASRLGSIVNSSYLQVNTPQSTGSVNINRINGQVQLLSPTGNVTSMQFLNFVTTATSGNQMTQVDVIVKQGATPYTVSLPTGNASIKYLSGTSNIAATANATSIITVRGANVSGAALYLVSVSGEYS